jgi:hypothetical protein
LKTQKDLLAKSEQKVKDLEAQLKPQNKPQVANIERKSVKPPASTNARASVKPGAEFRKTRQVDRESKRISIMNTVDSVLREVYIEEIDQKIK